MRNAIFSVLTGFIALSTAFAIGSEGANAAAIVGQSSTIQVISAPANVQSGSVESDDFFSVFEEQTTFVTGLAVNATVAGDPFVGGTSTPGSVTGYVTSFFVHYDPVTSLDALNGFLAFDGPILGLIWNQSELNASDGIVGAPGTTYTPQSSRDYESGNDQVIFTSVNQVDFQALAGNSVDSLRVIVAATAVPEPGALAVFGLGLGLGALALARRRRG